MKSYESNWTGTKRELHAVMDFLICKIKDDMKIELDDVSMRKLFIEALTRNLVVNELKDMIAYILDEENEIE